MSVILTRKKLSALQMIAPEINWKKLRGEKLYDVLEKYPNAFPYVNQEKLMARFPVYFCRFLEKYPHYVTSINLSISSHIYLAGHIKDYKSGSIGGDFGYKVLEQLAAPISTFTPEEADKLLMYFPEYHVHFDIIQRAINSFRQLAMYSEESYQKVNPAVNPNMLSVVNNRPYLLVDLIKKDHFDKEYLCSLVKSELSIRTLILETKISPKYITHLHLLGCDSLETISYSNRFRYNEVLIELAERKVSGDLTLDTN